MDKKKRAMALALYADWSHRPVQETCQALGISRATFYRYAGIGGNASSVKEVSAGGRAQAEQTIMAGQQPQRQAPHPRSE